MAKFSIILPVRNGGSYISACIESILQQTFYDLELIILENCSTDDTYRFISAIEDTRVSVYPSASLLTIEQNWMRIKNIPRNGEFMTIIGHDDLLDKNYLATIDKLITQHPQASLYQTHFRYIDEKGDEIKKCLPMQEVQRPDMVVHNFLCNKMDIMGTGFMMRSHDFNTVGGMPDYPNLLFADMELWIELARPGYLAVSPVECFSYRKHKGATTSTSTDVKVLGAFDRFIDYLEKIKSQDPVLAIVIKQDCAQLLKEYCKGITHKILRTPSAKRQTPSVSEVIDKFREYGRRLKDDNSFEPLDTRAIQVGKIIDSTTFSRLLFLLFKKIVRKPIL